MSKKVYVFDEEGSRYEVNNIEAMLNELPDDGLELIYKSTRYFHEFNKTILELIKLGKIEQTEGNPYDVEGVEIGLEAFAEKIKDKLGEEVLAKFIEETDAQWEANKPSELDVPPTDEGKDESDTFHEN